MPKRRSFSGSVRNASEGDEQRASDAGLAAGRPVADRGRIDDSTLYLLILGVAAGVGSVVAYFDQPFWMQAPLAAIAACQGAVLVHRYHRAANATSPAQSANDIGETVRMESWISEPQRLARVRYRDTLWDPEVLGARQLKPNALLYVVATRGSRLTVSAIRPSEPTPNKTGAFS